MTNALPTCLLVLALFCQAQAYPGGTPTKDSTSRLLSSHQLQPAQDTTKGNKRPITSAQLAIVIAPQQVAKMSDSQQLEQPIIAEAMAPVEAAEFNAETASLPGALASTLRRPEAPLGRRCFRTRLVRTGRFATRREAVEILTCTYAGPLVLAQLPGAGATPAQLLAGPGYDQAATLRPLELTQEAVLRLCGDRASQVRAYAMLYNLHFQQADEVARLLDYYNRIAVVVSK